jgi:hypothetical protein
MYSTCFTRAETLIYDYPMRVAISLLYPEPEKLLDSLTIITKSFILSGGIGLIQRDRSALDIKD